MRLSPGDIVQYRTPGSFFPLWPAVICEDNMATGDVLGSRPHGKSTLVLLMGEDLVL